MTSSAMRILWACVCLFMLALTAQAEEEEGEVVAPKAQYLELKPPFVANFGAGPGKLNYIKADISLRVPSSMAAAMIESNNALVRHHIVMTLSGLSEEAMSSPTSQEDVRLAALVAIQEALTEETGEPQVDDLLFTSFVVQR